MSMQDYRCMCGDTDCPSCGTAQGTLVECPDGGHCHHNCDPAACFRVRHASPLPGVFPGDRWPAEAGESNGGVDPFAADPRSDPMPATWPGDDPLDRALHELPPLDFEAQRETAQYVEDVQAGIRPEDPGIGVVARKTEPIPPVTVTPPYCGPGMFARRVRDNLARLAVEPDLGDTLRAVARHTLEMAERTVEEVALIEDQSGPRLLTVPHHLDDADLEALRAAMEQSAHQPLMLIRDNPPPAAGPLALSAGDIDELATKIGARVTEMLAAEPLLALLAAAREWADWFEDDLGDVVARNLKASVEACAGIGALINDQPGPEVT